MANLVAKRTPYVAYANSGLRLRISELNSVDAVDGDDMLMGAREDENVKIYASQLLSYLTTGDGKLLITIGAPDPSKGVNGEYALDPASGMIYGPKVNNIWPNGQPLTAFKLSDQYTSLSAFQGGEIFHVEQNGANYLATIDQVKNYVTGQMPATNNNVDGGSF